MTYGSEEAYLVSLLQQLYCDSYRDTFNSHDNGLRNKAHRPPGCL